MGDPPASRATNRRLLHLTRRSNERPCGGSSPLSRFRGIGPHRWPQRLERALPRGAGGDRRLERAALDVSFRAAARNLVSARTKAPERRAPSCLGMTPGAAALVIAPPVTPHL